MFGAQGFLQGFNLKYYIQDPKNAAEFGWKQKRNH